MAELGLKLILENAWLGFGSLALLFTLTRIPRCPAAPLALAASIIAGWATGKTGIASPVAVTPGMPQLVVPSWPEVWRSVSDMTARRAPGSYVGDREARAHG